ncbi:MAG: 2-C-methyl-D-erythritol 4-phosphate cytidylyltransferase [Acidobacteriota bacterium]|nr:2-C-methyl-D-erythritol 4-phosphate cytidylyltransferase [Acidobacteriota bacterium]
MRGASVIIVAAGRGKRFGAAKQFAALAGRPLLDWSLETFQRHEDIREIILVLPDEKAGEEYAGRYSKIRAVAKGGKERQDSVWNGFCRLDPGSAGLVLVHDGARPLVSAGLISRIIEAGRRKKAVIPALPVEETVKNAARGRVVRTIDRDDIVRVQTPQAFAYPLLKRALEAARRKRFHGTDEAMLLERLGETVWIVPGEPVNLKITTPLDISIAEAWLGI